MVPIIKKKNEIFLSDMLRKSELLIEKKFLIRIDIFPDSELLPYENGTFNRYVFSSNYSCKNKFDMVYKSCFEKLFLFDNDSIMEICNDLDIDNTLDEESILNLAYTMNREVFDNYKFDYERWEEIEFYKINITGIDNFEKKINYQGAFWGHTDSIDNGYYYFYSFINILGTLKNNNRKIFHDLIIESYSLFIEERFKQSFYIAYSAFENFINEKYYNNFPSQDRNIRLEQKIILIFNNNSSNEIFDFLKNNLKKYTNTRNDIAHGNNTNKIEKKHVVNLLNLVLSTIISYEQNIMQINLLNQ